MKGLKAFKQLLLEVLPKNDRNINQKKKKKKKKEKEKKYCTIKKTLESEGVDVEIEFLITISSMSSGKVPERKANYSLVAPKV